MQRAEGTSRDARRYSKLVTFYSWAMGDCVVRLEGSSLPTNISHRHTPYRHSLPTNHWRWRQQPFNSGEELHKRQKSIDNHYDDAEADESYEGISTPPRTLPSSDGHHGSGNSSSSSSPHSNRSSPSRGGGNHHVPIVEQRGTIPRSVDFSKLFHLLAKYHSYVPTTIKNVIDTRK